ncbi:hypothetical protein BBJ28_00005567, partial [Nothophytophthora sp. Chile5]
VVVLATDDSLDEADVHSTGISHVSYSDDPKYNAIPTIPKINVMVYDNDKSGFMVNKTRVFVTEGLGAIDNYSVVLTTEPFAKVTVSIVNVGLVGNLALANPSQLVFTWRNWNVSQTVFVTAVDDQTQDPVGSSSTLNHSLTTNDLIYAGLRNLTAVTVVITDNDVSGLELSTHELHGLESNSTVLSYAVRLTSEPWRPVIVQPNASHDCYLRVLTAERVCNASILSASRSLYFGAGNWNVWQNASLLAVDDWLDEAAVHSARISHASLSADPLYNVTEYPSSSGDVTLFITDNDVSFVTIALGSATQQLHVTEGSFNDSYSLVLTSEPYDNVTVTLRPTIETIVSLTNPTNSVQAPQVGVSYGSLASSSMTLATAASVRAIGVVFTSLDWMQLRVVTVFAIDDEIPEAPTQYSTITHAVASADANYNVSNSSIGIVSVAVAISDRESTPPPLPLTAIFDSSGSKVDVAFDSTVFHAASMDVSSSGAYVIRLKTFDCSLVFNLASAKYSLGSQASCLWLDGNDLRVQLGAGATLAVADKLVLNDCTSFTNQYCNATDVLRAKPTSRAFSQASISVQAPSDIIQPSAVLVVPEDVGSCGVWSADASLSSGDGGRPFALFVWFAQPSSLYPNASSQDDAGAGLALSQRLNGSLDSLCTKYMVDWMTGKSSFAFIPTEDLALASSSSSSAAADLSTLSTMAQLRSACSLRSIAQAATASGALQLQVNSSLLEPGTEYRVGLELANAFGQRTVAVKAIQMRSLPGPAVFIVGDSTQNVTRVGAPLLLQVDSVVSCPSVSGADVGYRWVVTSQSSSGSGSIAPEDLSQDNLARDPRVFRLPRTSLRADRIYTFRVEAYMTGSLSNQSSSSFASVVVYVASSAPQVSITGGDCAIGDQDTLLLDGSGTVDPDASSTALTYSWTCQDITDPLVSPAICKDASISPAVALDLTASSNAVLTIPPFKLQSGRQLQFSLTASKGAYNATASTAVWILEGHLPIVQTSASAAKINPSSRLTMEAQVSSDYPYTARWEQTQGDLVLPDATAGDSSDAFALPLTSLSNAILKNTLTAGLTYGFRLVASDSEGNVGFGSISVVVNSPPSSGTFTVTPQSGYAMQDVFTLSCSQWSDDVNDFPLTYSFGVLSTSSFQALNNATTDIGVLVELLQKAMTPLVVNQPSPQATSTMFPPGNMQDSEEMTVVAFISDILGAVAVASASIEVLLPAEAKSQPVAFVAGMFTSDGSLRAGGDAAENVRGVMSVALVLESAFAKKSSASGTRRLSVGCADGFMGPDCTIAVALVQQVDTAILSTVAKAANSVEPSSPGLGLQARVLGSLMRGAPEVLTASAVTEITWLSSAIANSALGLDVPADFVSSAGSTLVEVVSAVLVLGTAGTTSSSDTQRRRLTEISSSAANATAGDGSCGDQEETAQTKASLANILQTLLSLAAVGSQELLTGEPPAVLTAGDVTAFSAKGVSFTAQPTSALAMNLTATAVACLDPDLFLDALAFVTSPHSNCSLNSSQAISRAMVFSVHSQTAFDHATASSLDDGIAMQTLTSTSVCVAQASEASRRLTAASTAWNPLVALTIPHDRELSAIEQSNFSTTCRTWDPEISRWVADVCFKDDSASTSELTVCYCTRLEAALEVLVTLEERLDFYALHPDLYRHDPPSLVVSMTLVVLVAAFVIVAKTGQRLDARDAQREKATTIKRLNRSKWSELEARTQAANVFEDFDVFYAAQQQKKKLELQVSEAQTSPTVDDEASVTGFSSSARGSRVHNLSVDEPLDPTVELPDEARTLFESSRPLSRQYARLTLLFRLSNLLLVLLGIVLLLAGLEVQFLLGHSPAELVLNLYSGPLGLVLLGSGALLLVGGIAGVLLARRDASNGARTAYLTALGVALLLQLFVVALVFQSLEDFGSLPRGVALTLRSHWDSLSAETKTQLQASYGCCGFLTINEQTACPEEALDAVPPRTCSMVLATQAQTLFSSSFGYVQAVFLVEMACVALANLLVRWRRFRLLQLASGDAVDAAMLRSQPTVALLCSLPPLYGLLATGAAAAALFGLDLLLHWHLIADALVSALFGLEIGAIVTTAAVLYLLLMLRALHVLGTRNVLALRWVAVLSLAFLLLTMGFNGYLTRLRVDFSLDPTISEAVEAKYVALPRSTTLLGLEMDMGCCGFRINSQGSCISSGDVEMPTCRLQVEQALVAALALATDRLTVFAVVQAVVLALTFWLCLLLRRFAGLTAIRPTTTAEQPVLRPQSPSEHVCLAGLTLLNVGAAAAGVGVLCLGLDVLLELNVLHLSYLLRVFDRRLGVYLLTLGGCMELFAALGGLVAWMGPRSSSPSTRTRQHRLTVGYMLACVLLFLTAFGLLGVSHKFSLQLTPASNADDVAPAAVDARLEDRWRSASSSTKQFVQNALQCCGYERVEAANGSVTFTLPAEQFAWRRLTTTTTHYVYKTREHSTVTESWTPRLLTETQAETPLNGSALCPVEASDGCVNPMKRYLSRVARLGWQLCAGLASFSVAALICCCGLQVGSSSSSKTWTPNWRLRLKRAVLLLVVLLGGLAALVCLFLGVDVAAGWTLFSSSALQLVFARSLGASLAVYAVLALLNHGYSVRAAVTYSVHQLFLQIVTRLVLAFALFAGVAFTAHLSRYSAASDESWHEQLTTFLDDQWSDLTPATQHAISLEFACCGFNDPVLVAGKGVVFDRPALGYPSCSLALSRGCKRPLAAGVTSSFAWLFSFLLALALMELTAMALGALVLRDVRLHEREAWFKLESRLRYVLGSFRRDFRRRHVLVSVAARYDARLTRAQRAVSVLCAWAASLAVFAGHFATQGCYRSALKTCEQPGAAELLGLALVYGGLVGVAVQAAVIALFELVRHRVDHETKEVASARQRKEKVLLFRSSWFPRRRSNGSSMPSLMTEQTASGLAGSTLDTTQTTTEERWYAWLTRFMAGAFQACGVVLFLGGCALATLLGLLQLGYNNSLYGVSLDDEIPQLLGLALALVGVSLLVALANDLREQQAKRSHRRKLTPVIVTLVAVAITATLALGAVLLAVFMVHEVVQDDATAQTSWSVRVTGFSVVEQLQAAWNQESSGYMKDAVQQELRCCGFQSATDAPFLPCPDGDPVQVAYEALSVSGAVVATTRQEFEPLVGCLAPMLARFQRGADVVTYCALSAAGLLFLLTVSALFLARDLAISKDSKLKLRVPDTSSPEESKQDVRETFATVVGLKIAAPTRGKLRSQLMASSLESVTPAVASELAAAPLKHEELLVASAPASQGRLHDDDEDAGDYKEPQELQVSAKEDATAAEAEADASVPYPASVVYVIFSMCLLWLAIMAYVVAVSAMELGLATSWRCVLAWAVGVAMLELVVEPAVLFAAIVARTLRDWWSRTLLARLLRRGRAALRIGPQDAAREQLAKSLTLYERLRFAAAVRIQRRLLTRVTRTRYLRRLRDHKQEQHRLLATHRRETLRKTLASFSEEEIEAFRLLFVSADAPQLGLVSHTTIAQAVYELGVQVPASKVRELLDAFDPAYADLVDFEHFLYGMHCVRLHHQQLQTKGQSSDAAKTTEGEQLLSPSDRFGPGADPRATLLAKRQNLLRELHDRRESLAHKLLRKVSGRLPPLLQRGKSARAATPAITEPAEELAEETTQDNDAAAPSGSHVLWQNRKLSPKKRALESVMKKKHRDRVPLEQQGATTDGGDTDGVVSSARVVVKVTKTSPSKASGSPTRLAMKKLANRTVATPRGATPATRTAIPALPSVSSEAVPAIPLLSTVATAPTGYDREEEKAAIPAVSASEGGVERLAVAHAFAVATATEKGTTATDEAAAAEAELRAVVDDTPKEEASKLEEKAPKASATPEEAKPFGAYLLLTKQSPPLSGKISGVTNKEKSQLTIGDEEMGAQTHVDADSEDDAVAPSPHPVPAAKLKASGAQSALEKALLKKKKTKSKTPGSGGGKSSEREAQSSQEGRKEATALRPHPTRSRPRRERLGRWDTMFSVCAAALALLRVSSASAATVSEPTTSSSSNDGEWNVDDGLVFLPHASMGLEVMCVAVYLSLALVSACRVLSLMSSRQASAFQSSRRNTFQSLMVLFAVTRAASFLSEGVLRNLLNRAALCFFFSLVLFQVLFWIDIANPKISRRSRRIWIAFVLANGVFYAFVLGLSVVHFTKVSEAEQTRTQLDRPVLWTGVLPVLLIALGSFVSSLGLVYSTWQMRHRVARVLKPSGDGLRRRVDQRVERKLTRALRFTILVMGICSVLFLLRTIIYIQRPFSHQGCGDIHDPNVCVVVGYAIPEVVPCVLFLILMWEVEPNLQFPSRRSLSFNNGMVTSETTPLLEKDALQRPLVLKTNQQQANGLGAAASLAAGLPNSPPGSQGGYLSVGRRPSPLSLGLGGGVLDRARRRLELVVRQHLGGGNKEQHELPTIDRTERHEFATANSAPPAFERERHAKQVAIPDRPWNSDANWPTQTTPSAPYAWLSFQCFNLKLPTKSSLASSSFVVLDLMDPETGAVLTEVGRTEISSSEDPCFHMMLAVEMRDQDLLRASVYSVRNPSSLEDLNSQWLVGDPLVPLSSFMSGSKLVVGRASIYSLFSPLSRSRSSGEIVIRCEAEMKTMNAGMSAGGLERITRSFMYIGIENTDTQTPSPPPTSEYSEIAQQMIELASTSQRAQGKMLVEEELIESVYTWEVPYQLLQLILSDLLVKLDSLKHEIAVEDGGESSSSTPSSQLSTPSVGGYSLASAIPASPLGAVQESEVGNATLSSEEAEFVTPSASATVSPLDSENRVRATASIGMLSEMIIQIQDDAVERKKRKWRLELIKTMENYISEVEDSILRYGATQHAGLTFKPSTMKADADLRFLALNLHQQLMTVGNAAPTSENDVQHGDQASASRYARLVNTFVGTFLSSPHLSRESSVHGRQTDLDTMQFMDNEGIDENDVAQPPTSEEVPLEPVEALRRRVISFDSAETIVSKGAAGQGVVVPSEQRKLAETIVAMGITEEEFQSIYGIDDSVESPKAAVVTVETISSDCESAVAEEELGRSSDAASDERSNAETRHRSRSPFHKHRMYGTTTVGAFAAHVYGFKSGGVRQMREELERLHARLVKEAQTGSDLTMDALERKYNELKWDVERRLEVAFCQSMSALVTCFQQTLYVHTHDHLDFGPHALKARGIDYLEMISNVGFLFSVESLLSTYGKELGMLGDTEAAVKELARVQIKLRPVKTPRAAAFRVSITSGPSDIMIELPIITRRASEFPDRSMHRTPGQDAFSGAVYLPLSTAEQKQRAKSLFRKPIRVVPVLFSQGMNEMQTVANTVGKASLQKEINAENVVELETYVNRFVEWCSMKEEDTSSADAPSSIYDAVDLDRIQTSLMALRISIQLSGRSKRMAILSLSSSIARSIGGGRVTMCKSAKDRTSMSITLEEANLLARSHGLIVDELEPFTNLLRTYGVRRENARKNIGKAQYCFSALQNYMLPQDYQCPPGTGGGSRSFS